MAASARASISGLGCQNAKRGARKKAAVTILEKTYCLNDSSFYYLEYFFTFQIKIYTYWIPVWALFQSKLRFFIPYSCSVGEIVLTSSWPMTLCTLLSVTLYMLCLRRTSPKPLFIQLLMSRVLWRISGSGGGGTRPTTCKADSMRHGVHQKATNPILLRDHIPTTSIWSLRKEGAMIDGCPRAALTTLWPPWAIVWRRGARVANGAL